VIRASWKKVTGLIIFPAFHFSTGMPTIKTSDNKGFVRKALLKCSKTDSFMYGCERAIFQIA